MKEERVIIGNVEHFCRCVIEAAHSFVDTRNKVQTLKAMELLNVMP